MNESKVLITVIILLVMLALVIGSVIANNQREESPEIAHTKEAIAIRWLWISMALKVAFGLIVLAFLGGLAYAAVRLALKRATTIYPDHSGLYPVVQCRVGNSRVFHDPNRTPVATTVYTPQGVTFVASPDPSPGQLQVTGQAQVAQALRAAASGVGLPPATAEKIVGGGPQDPLVRPLPPVEVWDVEPAHVARLLEEIGDGEE
ncbi:MAG: hypothetical protein H5T62_03390 [Anaerolineae bacterium]|nr:hypothetical protein [Anaerolineae bacterium]